MGVTILRLILALIFVMQGYGKVVTWGVDDVFEMDFFYGTYKDLLPYSLIYATAYYTSYVELIGGLLLLVGWKRNLALYALGSVLIIVSFGHGLVDPIWDLDHVFYRTVMLVALLILPESLDIYTIDNLINWFKS